MRHLTKHGTLPVGCFSGMKPPHSLSARHGCGNTALRCGGKNLRYREIVEAVQECALYTGNVILGHSSGVENSCNVIDSHFVIESSVITEAEYGKIRRILKVRELQ